LARLLDQLHPDRPLTRGYARVSARAGGTVTSRAAAAAAKALTLHFADGAIDARVEGAGKPAYSPPKGPQPSLFD
ncbi:MAG: exodeoxyribonuclease VII large subunit, partial [Sphingomonadaceae bacterium]|nr:exodeoxyribonuclease VII large subunit [Sphingomonadaceae bacterium]